MINKKFSDKPWGLKIIIAYFVLTIMISVLSLANMYALTGTNEITKLVGSGAIITEIYSDNLQSTGSFNLILITTIPIIIINLFVIFGLFVQKLWGFWLTVIYLGITAILSVYSVFVGRGGIIGILISMLNHVLKVFTCC